MARVILKQAIPPLKFQEIYPAWLVSGFGKTSHYIWEDDRGFLKTSCGKSWMMSDAVTSRQEKDRPDAKRCRRCARRNSAGP